jgi:hypothetical protein
MAEIEHEIRTPETRLTVGPVLTKEKARKLGVKWTNSVASSLAGQEYNPSLFEQLWYPKEEEPESEPSVMALFQKLLDIFCKLFVKEE